MPNTEPALPVVPSWRIGVVIGFATAVVMWLIAFFLHLQGITAHASITGIALILAQFAGCMFAGRYASADRPPWRLGLATGLTVSVLNLFILGAVIAEPASTEAEAALRPNAGVMVAGYLLIGTLVGILSAIAGNRWLPKSNDDAPEDPDHDRWVARFAWVAAFAVVPVLFTGGLTTSNQAGLAVPDWPNTYATNMFLYPVSQMTGGTLYEHTHRLFGSLAGITVLGLLFYSLIARLTSKSHPAKRRAFYTRATLLALCAGVAVLAQGILGGIRVTAADGASDQEAWLTSSQQLTPDQITRSFALTSDNPTSLSLALVHGVTGQLTFVLLCVIACVLSRRWIRSAGRPRTPDAVLAFAAPAFFFTAVLQLALGSALRHTHSQHALFAHIGFALVVVTAGIIACSRAIMRHPESRPISTLGKAMVVVVITQFAFGWIALLAVVPHYPEPGVGTNPLTPERPPSSVLIATGHQMTGALLLALGGMLMLWTARHITSKRRSVDERDSVTAA